MADTIDSISIELTASTKSAEDSIQRVIDALRMLQAAAIDASAESRIGKSIRSIAKAAKEVDTDAGQRLARLAGGLKALSKVGDLSNLADAGKNLSGVVRAVNSIGQSGGNGLSGLANGIKQTSDALGSIKDTDVSKLNAVKDALSGEMSGSLHTNARVNESTALGGMGTPEPSFGNMAAYGAMTVFKYTADSIRDAAMAYREFQTALSSGSQPIFTQFADGAMTVFKYTADSIRDATAAYREFRAALGGGVPPIFTNFANDAARSGGSVRMLTGNVGSNNEGPWVADEIRDTARAYDDLGNSASRAADVIETEFVNPTGSAFSTLNNIIWGLVNSISHIGSGFSGIGSMLGMVGHAASTVGSGFMQFTGIAGFAKDILYGIGNDADTASKKMGGLAKMAQNVGGAFSRYGFAAIPKYFGGQLIGNIQKATKGLTGFFHSIVRIAKYRLIRTALRMITQGINEGIKNLYNWSRTADTTFYKSMNTIATATQYLGNSFAAMASPLVNALAPAIDYVVDKFVDMFNIINQVFARLSGSTTYTAAKKVAAEWDDATESAKQYKNTLLGFDEINKLNDDTGGSKKKETDYGSMFETRQITGPVSQFADQLRAMVDSADWQGLGQLLGGKVNELIDNIDFAGAGAKVGAGINAWFTTKYWTLDTINFTNIGSKIAEFLNNAINEINFNILGRLMVQKLTIIGDLIIGFFTNFDWGQAADSYSKFVVGMYNEITKWVGKYDWGDIGLTLYQKLKDIWDHFDFAEIASSFVTMLGTAIRSLVHTGAGFIAGFWADVSAWWSENIKADTFSQTVTNILEAISHGFKNMGDWAWTNIINPFITSLTGNENWSTELIGWLQGLIPDIKNEKILSGLLNGTELAIGTALFLIGGPAMKLLGLGLLVSGGYGLGKEIAESGIIEWFTQKMAIIKNDNILNGILIGTELAVGLALLLLGHPLLGLGLLISGGYGLGKEIAESDPISWINTKLESLKTGIDTALKDINGWIGEHIWKPIIVALTGDENAEWQSQVGNIGRLLIEKIKEGISEKVKGFKGWINEHIFKPFVDAWHWLLGIFGGDGRDKEGQPTSNANGVGQEVIEDTDTETMQQLKALGGSMGDAIKAGLLDRMNGVADDIWKKIKNSWTDTDRKLSITMAMSPDITTLWNTFIEKWTTKTLTIYIGTNVDADTLFSLIEQAWGTRTLTITLGTNVSADDLYDLFKTRWNNTGSKTLYFSPELDNTPEILYKSFMRAWDDSGSKTLYFSPKLDNDASVLWSSFKSEWNDQTRTLYASPKLDNTGKTLFNKFKNEWDDACVPLYASPKLDNKGGVIWDTFKKEWNNARVMLYASPKLDNTGNTLWNSFKEEWNNARTALYAAPKLDNKGNVLWNTFKGEWDNARMPLYASPKLDHSGADIWRTFRDEWNNARVTLYGSPKLDNTGAVLWQGFKKEWNNSNPVVGVSVQLNDPTTQEVTTFWGRLSDAWNSAVIAVDKGLDVIVRPVSHKTGEILENMFNRIGEWLFGKKDVPEQYIRINARPGAGLSRKTAYASDVFEVNIDDDVGVKVNLEPGWLGSLQDWFNNMFIGDPIVDIIANLTSNKSNWITDGLQKWFNKQTGSKGGKTNPGVDIKGNLQKGDNMKQSTIFDWIGAAGGILRLTINLVGKAWNALISFLKTLAGSGSRNDFGIDEDVISNMMSSSGGSVAQYASGTTNAHGSLFLAGEAGPEIVGHVGGRTEVLNKSQLASTMYAAVRSAMGGVRLTFEGGDGGAQDNREADYETMYRAMYDAFSAAMARGDERDREKVALLRQISEKEFRTDISTSDINRAQTRANRRAGITVVPVGT